jgi:hypothetical protein
MSTKAYVGSGKPQDWLGTHVANDGYYEGVGLQFER